MTNERTPRNNGQNESLFLSNDIENDIGSEVQSMMESGTEEAAISEGATVFVNVSDSNFSATAKRSAPVAEEITSHTILVDPIVGNEILADEDAISGSALSHPEDMEMDQILEEAKTLDTEESSAQAPTNIDGMNFNTMVFDAQQMPPIQDYVDPNEPIEPEVTVEEILEEEPPLPKRRPKMKKGYGLLGIPHIISTIIWLAITVAIGVSLGRMIWICAAEVLAFGRPDEEYVMTVTNADNIDTIATKLKNAGLIKYPELFKFYADLTDAEEDISVGTFTLNSKYDYHALVNAMSYHSPLSVKHSGNAGGRKADGRLSLQLCMGRDVCDQRGERRM